jgi:hypothetical protein
VRYVPLTVHQACVKKLTAMSRIWYAPGESKEKFDPMKCRNDTRERERREAEGDGRRRGRRRRRAIKKKKKKKKKKKRMGRQIAAHVTVPVENMKLLKAHPRVIMREGGKENGEMSSGA